MNWKKSNSILRKQNEVQQESMTKEPDCNCHKRTSDTDHIVTNLHEKVSKFILQQIDAQVDNMFCSIQSTIPKGSDIYSNNNHDQSSTIQSTIPKGSDIYSNNSNDQSSTKSKKSKSKSTYS